MTTLDPLDRRHPRLAAAVVAGAGLLVGIPVVLVAAAAVEFAAQARKVVFDATRTSERRGA